MCGRVIQTTSPEAIRRLFDIREPAPNAPPRYNAAPSQDLMVIRRHPETGERSLDLLRWGLIPHWIRDTRGGRRPINARAETVAKSPMFKAAFLNRRCLVPVDGFFEWRAIRGARAKQPYAVAMKDSSPFALAAIWENWQQPDTGEWIRTFAILTCPANEMMAAIHDRMPVIIAPADYDRWLDPARDPHKLLRPFPAEPMTMWPVSRRANSPRNDDPGIIEPAGEEHGADVVVSAADDELARD